MNLSALPYRTGFTLLIAALCLAPASSQVADPTEAAPEPLFTAEEAQNVSDFWRTSGRYLISFANNDAPYQVRQTAEGSTWLLDYYRKARSQSSEKIIPGRAPTATNERQIEWNEWIDQRYAYDEYRAAQSAHNLNASLGYTGSVSLRAVADPGPCPADLRDFAGEPPAFNFATAVRQHTVQFDDLALTYQDNVKVRRKYAYYRFPAGVMDVGERMSNTGIENVRPLFEKAGVDDSKLRVMAAVSLLEGGFDSINTYDTGYVSVGFIQFACLSGGGGSLGQVLLTMKTTDPEAFQQDFRRFGLDVTPEGRMVALNLSTGQETIGADAAQTIIKDRRLTAVFQRAGRISEPFRLAQIQTALELYYPANDHIHIPLGTKTVVGKVSDIIKTEAGMATLMDRKVNTGSLGEFERAVSGIMLSYNLKRLDEVAAFEHELIQAMVYRDNYLEEGDLSKPKPNPRSTNR